MSTINDIEKIRVRIAPSPTGLLHIGLARTALFNYLFACQNQGKLILRIEDTDSERSKPQFEKNIVEGLQWLDIKWDEFYRQSERLDIYKQYIKKLLDEAHAYHCFCSEEELEAKRQERLSRGEPPIYDGKCQNLAPEIVKKYLREGKPSIIRFKTPLKKIVFDDLIRGKIEFESSLIGDFAIARNLNSPLFHLAVVVDDSEMKITHIIRGEEHISNTPKQILIQEALGFLTPKYAHLPLILGADKTKLSKRHGATSVAAYQEDGYLPEALINMMAFLGWNPGNEKEIYRMSSLIKEFSLSKVQKGGAIFNIKRLDWLNGFYIRQKPLEQLTELCIPYLVKAGLIEPINKSNTIPTAVGKVLDSDCSDDRSKTPELFKEKKPQFKIKETEEIVSFDYLEKIVSIEQERLKKLSEIIEMTDFFFKEKLEYDESLLKWKDMDNEELKDIFDRLEEILSEIEDNDFSKENLEKILMPKAEQTGDRGKLLWPLRAALTGKKASAPPFEVAEILGKKKTLKRIKNAIVLLKTL